MPRIYLRGGTATGMSETNPILHAREAGVETDTGKVKIGDGTTHWDDLPYTDSGSAATATSGLLEDRPVSPAKGQRYLATDEGLIYEALTVGTWTVLGITPDKAIEYAIVFGS